MNKEEIKPKPHSEEKQLPMTFNSKTFGVDETIYDLVKLLNENYKPTVASCSGHGHQPTSIIFNDDTEMMIMTYEQARKVDKLFPDINGEEKYISKVEVKEEILTRIKLLKEQEEEYQEQFLNKDSISELYELIRTFKL